MFNCFNAMLTIFTQLLRSFFSWPNFSTYNMMESGEDSCSTANPEGQGLRSQHNEVCIL